MKEEDGYVSLSRVESVLEISLSEAWLNSPPLGGGELVHGSSKGDVLGFTIGVWNDDKKQYLSLQWEPWPKNYQGYPAGYCIPFEKAKDDLSELGWIIKYKNTGPFHGYIMIKENGEINISGNGNCLLQFTISSASHLQ